MKYYKTDSRKISFKEYWHISPRGFWIAWLNKILGKQMNLIRGIPEPQPFKSRVIEPATIPKAILEKINSEILNLKKLGFDQFWYFSSKQSLTGGGGYAVEGLHSSCQILAKVLFVYFKTREHLVIVLFSRYNDGPVLATTNKKPAFNPPSNHIVQRKIGARAGFLFNWHQKKLTEMSRTKLLQKFAGLDEAANFEDRLVQETYDDKIKRGIWVEMTEAEVAVLRERPPRATLMLPR